MRGTLFIVSTPIGNLKDITFRAIETLTSVDYILCEDTRVTGRLLHQYGIQKRMVVLNDFNESDKIKDVILSLESGENVALVSDSGTPLISDPGFKLVRETIACDIKVESIPGATAISSALTVSGFATDKFLFLGFLPKKYGKRQEILTHVRSARDQVKSTVIIYESPFRVLKTLLEIKDIFGDIEIALCRELTKIHEEVIRGKISEIASQIKPKGEFVLIF